MKSVELRLPSHIEICSLFIDEIPQQRGMFPDFMLNINLVFLQQNSFYLFNNL